MHLLIPFASALSQPAVQVLRGLSLPHLAALLARLTPTRRDHAEPTTLSPPHERAWAAAQQWHGEDGGLPFAAHAAAADGIEVGDAPWGMVTPTHWLVGRDHVSLVDPAELHLDEARSRAAFDAVRALFEDGHDDHGWRIVWGAPLRWYVSHPRLDGLRCASLDRAIGRNVEPWLQRTADPLLRRLQSEVQMLLYPHPLNAERERDGELPINSFWLAGCGRAQPAPAAIEVDERLRAPLLANDWPAWERAWRELDDGPLARLAEQLDAGRAVTLTLCGERGALTATAAPRALWRRLADRFRGADTAAVLESL